MLFRTLALIVAAGALSGCYRLQAVDTPQPGGAKVGLWAETPEGCKFYIVHGSGTVERVVVCPNTYTVAGVGS